MHCSLTPTPREEQRGAEVFLLTQHTPDTHRKHREEQPLLHLHAAHRSFRLSLAMLIVAGTDREARPCLLRGFRDRLAIWATWPLKGRDFKGLETF